MLPIDDKDFRATIGEVAQRNGYAYETYEVQTEDGYILQLDRICMNETLDKADAPRALLMHGIEDSSIAWVVNSVDKAPAFLLANAGVDVWIGNNRGNMLSKKHVTKSPSNADFWDFSFEEMGLYDVPAFIDKILNETGSDMLDMYMGHSEGTTQFFIGSSMKSEYYASKVKLFSALAPIVRLDHNTNGGMNFAASIIDPIAWLVPRLHLYNLIDFPEEILVSYAYFCTQFPATCVKLDDTISDPNGEIDNLARYPTKLAHSPVGLGWRCLVHYGQIIHHKAFQRYDFGKSKNNELYGQDTPPEYDLSKIAVPIALYHGDVDPLSNPTDVAWLANDSGIDKDLIKLVKELHKAHNGFSIGADMSFITDDVIPMINEVHGA